MGSQVEQTEETKVGGKDGGKDGHIEKLQAEHGTADTAKSQRQAIAKTIEQADDGSNKYLAAVEIKTPKGEHATLVGGKVVQLSDAP
jgi:hypothetical protein